MFSYSKHFCMRASPAFYLSRRLLGSGSRRGNNRHPAARRLSATNYPPRHAEAKMPTGAADRRKPVDPVAPPPANHAAKAAAPLRRQAGEALLRKSIFFFLLHIFPVYKENETALEERFVGRSTYCYLRSFLSRELNF